MVHFTSMGMEAQMMGHVQVHINCQTLSNETRKSDIHIKDSRSAQPPAKTDATPSPRLEHPKWKATMNIIPKAARAQSATAFGDILIKIANEPTNLKSWNALLSLGQQSLPNHREEEPIGTRPMWC